MNVLFLCHNLTGGGAERVCACLAKGLSNIGYKVGILTDLKQKPSYDVGKNVLLIQNEYKGSSFLARRISVYKFMRTVINDFNPDVIISIQPYFTDIARFITWFNHRCPIVMTEHDAFERPISSPFTFKKYVDKFWMNFLYDYITVLTDSDYKIISRRFKNVTVMPNPLYLEPLTTTVKREKIILAVGRINDWHCKGFDVLIKSWNRIYMNYPDWKLRIIGHGNKENIDYLYSLCNDINSIEILSYTNKIEEYYRKAEIFVLSSRYEGFGLVLIEAMSQGCASIACDFKGRQRDIINEGLNGLICSIEDDIELSDKIALLIDDADLRKQIQINAIESVNRFSVDNIVSYWDKFLKNIVR